MKFYEECISSERKYSGKVFKVRLDEVRLQNGDTAFREVFEHCGGVGILAVDKDGKYALVRQYRYCVEQELYEIPAGKLERGEDSREGALRELREEVGAVPEEFVYLGKIYPSPGCMTEELHVYFAMGLDIFEQRLDEDEFLETKWFAKDEIMRMIADGTITDAKTIAAFMMAEVKLKI